jgi:hypothetical protein
MTLQLLLNTKTAKIGWLQTTCDHTWPPFFALHKQFGSNATPAPAIAAVDNCEP